MPIHGGLAALRVRQDADPIYIHDVCKQILKEHLGMGDPETRLLKVRCLRPSYRRVGFRSRHADGTASLVDDNE
jgi:hypothetical protein